MDRKKENKEHDYNSVDDMGNYLDGVMAADLMRHMSSFGN